MLMFYKSNWRVRKAWISSSAMKRLEQKSSPFWKLNEWKQFKILTFFWTWNVLWEKREGKRSYWAKYAAQKRHVKRRIFCIFLDVFKMIVKFSFFHLILIDLSTNLSYCLLVFTYSVVSSQYPMVLLGLQTKRRFITLTALKSKY